MLKKLLFILLSIATIIEIFFACLVFKIDENENKNKLSLSSISSLIEKKDEFEDYFAPFGAIPKIFEYKMFGVIPAYWLLILIGIGFLFEKMKKHWTIARFFIKPFILIFLFIWELILKLFKLIKSYFRR